MDYYLFLLSTFLSFFNQREGKRLECSEMYYSIDASELIQYFLSSLSVNRHTSSCFVNQISTSNHNALLKLVKWNQITSSMDLVPFNQL